MEETTRKKIQKHFRDYSESVEDVLAAEKKLNISVNGKKCLSTYCTPSMIRELVVGLLGSEGIIKRGCCLDRIRIEYGDEIHADIPSEEEAPSYERIITTGCGGGVTFDKEPRTADMQDEFSIKKENLKEIFREFHARSGLYRLTGCVHSAALSDGITLLYFAEDIGRHNAVDKVIGSALLEDIPFSDKILLASGRISSEISLKCSFWGIPVLASRAAPTSLSVDIAERNGITLIGFMRGERFNVYAHPHRIA